MHDTIACSQSDCSQNNWQKSSVPDVSIIDEELKWQSKCWDGLHIES